MREEAADSESRIVLEAVRGGGADGSRRRKRSCLRARELRGAGDEVRMTMDGARHDNAAGCIDFCRRARDGEILQTPRGADLADDTVFNQEGAVFDDAQILERHSPARTGGTAK